MSYIQFIFFDQVYGFIISSIIQTTLISIEYKSRTSKEYKNLKRFFTKSFLQYKQVFFLTVARDDQKDESLRNGRGHCDNFISEVVTRKSPGEERRTDLIVGGEGRCMWCGTEVHIQTGSRARTGVLSLGSTAEMGYGVSVKFELY